MVAGMERYYQIARCYRDEDFRADRQPEFTQLDIEMSFVDQDDVLAVAEDVLVALWKLIGYDVPTPLPRMTYAEAMARFGSDKPDLRMGLELVDCTAYFADTGFRVFQAPYVGAVVMPGGADQPRAPVRRLAGVGQAARRPRAGLRDRRRRRRARRPGGEEPQRRGAGRPRRPRRARARVTASSSPPDRSSQSRALLGAARLEIGRRGGLIDEDAWSFLWVVDAPLFEPADEATAAGDVAVGSGQWTAVHHAFTSPQDLDDLRPGPRQRRSPGPTTSSATATRSAAARSVSTATTSSERVFAVMGLDEDEAQEKFGFLLDAFQYGAPAARRHRLRLGPDRARCSRGADSIRDVIAFPKSGGGYDPLTGAPAPITLAAAPGGRCRRPSGARPHP